MGVWCRIEVKHISDMFRSLGYDRDISYIIGNGLMSTFQYKFNCLWDISKWRFYSNWWPDISVICCCFCTSHIYVDSPHLGLSSMTYFVKISPLVVKIQAEWSLWQLSYNSLKFIVNSQNIEWSNVLLQIYFNAQIVPFEKMVISQ